MLTDFLTYSFMQNALIGGLMISVICAVMSFFVVLKRLSFIGVGISHAAFGGVALAALAGFPIMLGAVGFALGMAWLIAFLREQGRLNEDTLIGIVFSAAMALGIVFVSLSKRFNADLFGYLFGSILSTTREDLLTIAILGAGVLITIRLFFKELLFVSFDEEIATISGVPVRFIYFLLLSLMALTIVVAMKIVGIILVSALLVVPAAAAHQVTHHYRTMLLLSVATGVISVVVGLSLSYRFDLASGATIVLVATAIFGILRGTAFCYKRVRAKA